MRSSRAMWKRYQELRPDELAAFTETSPVVFWPLGLIEHHGWHLPVGFDGIKAERICIRIAERTGGLLLPTMWWGAGGGHGDFLWTFYQSEGAAESILVNTTNKLIEFGFRAIVLLAGHYPWQGILERNVPAIQMGHPEVLLLWGTEMSICGRGLRLPGDHAAREETSYGLYLLPELVDMGALRPGRDLSAWPGGRAPALERRHPGVCFDPGDPLFAQMGEDARTASSERGEEGIACLVSCLATEINRHLGRE
ncbi:MAG: creatininase family protein [bacterium]